MSVTRMGGQEVVWRLPVYNRLLAILNNPLLLNLDYLEAKLTATDMNALIAEYDYLPEDKDLRTALTIY
jgi:hypothetical protein